MLEMLMALAYIINPYLLTPSRTLKPEAEADEDGVAMCSGPEEGEEVGWMKGWGGNGVEVPRLGWEWSGTEVHWPCKDNSVAFTTLCSCPKTEETASVSKRQLWPLNSGCGELPQVAMLTPPQECETDTCGPGTQPT